MKHREVLQKLNDLFPDKTYCGADFTSSRFTANKEGMFSHKYIVWAHFYKEEQDLFIEIDPKDITRIESTSGCRSWAEAYLTFKSAYLGYKISLEKLEVTE